MSRSTRRRLAGTDLDLSGLCLGGNRFGGDLSEDESFAVLDAFVGNGGNFIDTAHIYADWIAGNAPSSSERMIGRWMRARRADVVVATKGGHPPLSDPSQSRLDEKSLRRDAEEARIHLGVSAIELFYLHRDDPRQPVEEILGALEAMRADGLLRFYGASNWSAARLQEAHAVASRKSLQGFAANQAEWSFARRRPQAAQPDLCDMDAAMTAFHERTGCAAIPYSAQAKGYFEKSPDALDPATARLYDSERNRRVAQELRHAAERRGATPTALMLAAMMRTPFPTIPVIGCRSPAQVLVAMASLDLDLEPDDLRALLAMAGVSSPPSPPA